MTRRHRQSSSESASYSSATGRTHRRGTPTKEDYNDDDDADASDSQYNDEYQGDEFEQYEEEPDQDVEDDDVVNSESVSNTPPNDTSFSQEAHTYVPETPSISASNFPHPAKNSSSYVKIAPLPIFRGTPSESPITHLSRFNKVCRANNASSVDMQMKIFPVTLEDEAALWYDLNVEPYYPSLSWDEVKLSFLQAYYNVEPVEELRSELVGIRQGEGESVRSYFLRLQWILKRWPEHGLSEDLLRGVFVDGLREEFHDWVLMQKPNSLNDALRLAFGFQQLRSVRGKKGVVPTCGFCEGPHEERGCKVRKGMREVWRQSKQKEWSDGVAKDLVGSCSVGDSSGQGRVEMDEGGKGSEAIVGSVKKKQCQCSKHKCWKKKLLRSSSLESRISHCN
ncbi:14-3-3 protein epsilon [Spatholobus suberectus]|nr:14-3-3 protein epsilon [Spatholobus suberectus]